MVLPADVFVIHLWGVPLMYEETRPIFGIGLSTVFDLEGEYSRSRGLRSQEINRTHNMNVGKEYGECFSWCL